MAIAKRVSAEEIRAKQEKSQAELNAKVDPAVKAAVAEPSESNPKIVTKIEVPSRRKKVDIKKLVQFADRAPDGKTPDSVAKKKWALKGRKVVITVQLEPWLLERFDGLADELGMSRSGLIRNLVLEAVNEDDARSKGKR